ncbi:MAG TPA: divalent-cation tolerance protein CutA [Solirubrobacteraceae bacterium]|nr:divalent-cation tolerance protein CutA [Solirubrobacteraceae bacterium]
MAEDVCQIQVSHSDRDALQAIVEQLLEQRLIACGQVLGPISSSFRWEGQVQREQEWLALLKTSAALAEPVCARVAELHPYEVPEILVTELSGGHEPYLRWVLEQTATSLDDRPGG